MTYPIISPLNIVCRSYKQKNSNNKITRIHLVYTKHTNQANCCNNQKIKNIIFAYKRFKKNCENVYIATDDGSLGTKGFVTTVLQQLIDEGKKIDCVLVVGPMIMMKNVAELTRPYGIPTIVSMNCIMVDGTGMCGGCRLTVDGKIKYACVDGPEFDGHKVDFAGAMNRSRFYKEHEDKCRLRG